MKKILVAIKPWERGLPLAAQHARSLARAADSQIQLVTSVFDAAVGAACDRGEEAARRVRERTIDTALAGLERLAAPLRDSGVIVTTRAVWGAPAYEAILNAAEEWDAGLVVVGANDRATRHARLTDTDWQLLRRTRHPLLLVKSASFSGYGTVLAAVDPLHAHDEPAGLDHGVLEAARRLARACGSRLRAVYAYAGHAAFELASAVEVAPGVFYASENVEAVHRRAVTELATQFGIAPSEIDLIEGSAPQAIVDAAVRHQAGLLVVGTVQRRGAAAAIHANTAELVAGDVPCDVLLVPARQVAQSYSKVG